MAIDIAVHDNDTDKKAVNLITKRSRGQYRRWARHHNIQSRRETALNQHAKGKETMFHEGKHITTVAPRAHAIVSVIREALVDLSQTDALGRALGRVGFHTNIRPSERGTWADVHATSTTDVRTIISLRVYPLLKVVVFQNWRGTETDKLEKGLVEVDRSFPQDFQFIPNYDVLDRERNISGVDVIRRVLLMSPQRWIDRPNARTMLRAIEQREHQGALPLPSYDPGDIHPQDYSPTGSPLSRSLSSVGQPTLASSGATDRERQQQGQGVVPTPYNPPQRGFERSASRPYGGVAPETEFDYEMSALQRSGFSQRHDPREELPASGTPMGYVHNYTSSVGREGEPLVTLGGRSAPSFGVSPFYSPSAARAAAAIVPPFVPPSREISGAATAPSSQQPRIPDTDRSHRHLSGQPWGASHPAVLRVVGALQGLGQVHIGKPTRLGIPISADNGTTLLTLDLGGRSPRTRFHFGTLTFHTANIHRLQHFLDLIPRIAFKDSHPSASLPIIWKNDFRPLIDHVSIHAPDQLGNLASVLERLPKGNKMTGNINRLVRARGIPPLSGGR